MDLLIMRELVSPTRPEIRQRAPRVATRSRSARLTAPPVAFCSRRVSAGSSQGNRAERFKGGSGN